MQRSRSNTASPTLEAILAPRIVPQALSDYSGAQVKERREVVVRPSSDTGEFADSLAGIADELHKPR
jgi:hypothetical protein